MSVFVVGGFLLVSSVGFWVLDLRSIGFDPLFFSFFLFACRIARGHEEVSISQTRHRRGAPQETPTPSSLVTAMSVEELRLYNQIPVEILLSVKNMQELGANPSPYIVLILSHPLPNEVAKG